MSDLIDLLSGFAGRGGEGTTTGKKEGKFQASILTTYNAYFPFYETVILKRLTGSGCRHNILLADAGHVAQSLGAPWSQPQLAGRDYTLVPIQAKGAFHPKIALLIGKKAVRAFVGSHNATLSGFGHNRELTTKVDAEGPDDPNAPFVQAVWRFLEEWFLQQGHLPPALKDAFLRAGMTCPWLKHEKEQNGDLVFLGSSPEGESLWQRMRPLLPDREADQAKVSMLGPFFDRKGDFLSGLTKDLKATSVVVGIEPAKVKLCRVEGLSEKIRFHDSSAFGPRKGYLHAKAICIEFAKEIILITGSANPSAPAWTAAPAERNAEAVVLHRGETATRICSDLGMATVGDLPVLDAIALAKIPLAEEEDFTGNAGNRIAVVAEVTGDGIFVPKVLQSVEEISSIKVTFQGGASHLETTNYVRRPDGFVIPVPASNILSAVSVEVQLTSGMTLLVVIHHPAAIANLTRTSSQQRFRDALDSLNGDSPDLPTVIRLANALIFEEEDLQKVTRKVSASEKGDDGAQEVPLGPLSVPIEESRRNRRRLRQIRGSDLTYVIDILIHRLGIGLIAAAEQLEKQGPSEEELKGTEEDMTPPTEVSIDLAKACQGKVRTLVSRMIKQLEQARPEPEDAQKALGQLVAVLAVLREVKAQSLRLLENTGGQVLVPPEQERRLLESALATLFGRHKCLFELAKESFADDPDDDLARMLGLLIWLTWECRLDPRSLDRCRQWDGESYRESLLDTAKVLELAAAVAGYEEAFEEAHHSVWRTSKEGAKGNATVWLTRLKIWAKTVSDLNEHLDEFTGKEPKPGDVVIVAAEEKPKMRVVLGVDSSKVRMVELGAKKMEIGYQRRAVKSAPLPSFPS